MDKVSKLTICTNLRSLLVMNLFLIYNMLPTNVHDVNTVSTVEDTAILDASLDIVTSRKVRDKIKMGHTVGWFNIYFCVFVLCVLFNVLSIHAFPFFCS